METGTTGGGGGGGRKQWKGGIWGDKGERKKMTRTMSFQSGGAFLSFLKKGPNFAGGRLILEGPRLQLFVKLEPLFAKILKTCPDLQLCYK